MKKLFLVLMAFCAISASAQSFRVFYNGNVVGSNDTLDIEAELEDQVNVYFGYANIGSEDIFATIRKEVILSAPNSSSTFCAAGYCCEVETNEFQLTAGDTVPDNDDNAMHIIYNSVEPGTSLYKFTFKNSDNAADMFSFFVRFSQPVGIQTNAASVVLNASPNPATTNVTISYSTLSSGNNFLVVRNILGSEVYRVKVSDSGKQRIDVSSFKQGVYVYGIENNGRLLNAKKLLVK